MLKIDKNNKPINPSYLDSSLVILKHLSGWKNFIWSCWGNRTYLHNSHDMACSGMSFFLIIFSLASIAFFYYFPLKFIGLMALIGINSACALLPIKYANQSPVIIWIPMIVGMFGLANDWQFGFGAFGYHFETYFFWAFLIGGSLAVYRRCWNKLIWKALDKITLNYYAEHNLDLDTQTKIINNYELAYNTICQSLCQLIQQNSVIHFTSEQTQQIQTWLNNRTLISFEKAVNTIDQKLNK